MRLTPCQKTLVQAAAVASLGVGSATALAQYERTYGTEQDERLEWIEEVTGPAEEGYIMAGSRQTMDAAGNITGLNAYVIRTDLVGNVIWDVEVGSQQSFETAHRVIQASDGTIVVAGETNGSGAGLGTYLFKLTPGGALVWSRALPGTSFVGGSAGGTGLDEALNGDYLVSSRLQGSNSNQSPVLSRVTSGGAPVFTVEYVDATLGQQAFASFSDVHELDDERIVLSGYTSETGFPGGPRETLLMITRPDGLPIRANTYGFPQQTEWARDVEPARNGDFILTGFAKHIGEGGGTYLMRVDPSCNLLWYQTFQGYNVDTSLIEEASGDILLGGTTAFQTDDGPAILQTDSAGAYIQSWKYGGDLREFGEHAIPTQDGGYAFASWTESFGAGNFDTYLLDTDANFRTGCEQDFQPVLGTEQPIQEEIPFEAITLQNIADRMDEVRPPECRVFDPCPDDTEPTDKCHVPWDKKFCRFQNSRVVKMTICNCDDVAHDYDLSFASVPGSGGFFCGVDGPNTFTVLDPTPVNVGPGDCKDVCVRVFRPASMAAPGVMGCYDVTFTNLDTGNSVTCTGSMISSRRWCPIIVVGPVIDIPVTALNGVNFNLGIQNEGDDVSPPTPVRIDIMASDMSATQVPFSLDGLPPGEPLIRTLSPTPPGGTQNIPLTVLPDPGPTPDVFFDVFFDVILSIDDNNDGDFQPADSFAVRLVAPEVCPCDVDGNPGVGIDDLLFFLADWFANSGEIDELLGFLACWFQATIPGVACP